MMQMKTAAAAAAMSITQGKQAAESSSLNLRRSEMQGVLR
jgi:hypothetical protein